MTDAAAIEPGVVPDLSDDDPQARWERWINPIVFKDLLAYARGPSASGTRLILYALLFAVPLLAFAWALVFLPGPVRFAARPVFLVVCGLLAFFHLAVAVPAATAFALERDRNTLESLVVSPLSPWRLVLGKLAMALSIGALGKAAVLPALAVAFVLGGADLLFLPAYLLLLLAVDASLAAFALNLGARHREVQTKIGWIKAQTSQTQMAHQATVGLTVLTSLIPIYTVIFLIPLALQHGLRVAQVLEIIAPLGALHPLAALILWGQAEILGLPVPVWVLGILFHTLLALPLLADCAEAQNSEGSHPGRMTRLLALPLIGFVFLLTASVLAKCTAPVRPIASLIVPTLIVIYTAGRTGFGQPGVVPVTAREILRGFLPTRACESTPARGPGYVLLVCLLAAPLVIWGCGGGRQAWASFLALVLVGLSLAALGARLTARVREKDDVAFREALESGAATSADETKTDDDDDAGEEDEAQKAAPRRLLVYLLLGSTMIPAFTTAMLSAAEQGNLPLLTSIRPILPPIATLGIAINPFALVLPVVTDPALLGAAGPATLLTKLGVSGWGLFGLHVAIYSVILVAAFATIRRPLDLEQVLAEHAPAPGAPPVSPPADPPPGDAPDAPTDDSPPDGAPDPTADAPDPPPDPTADAPDPPPDGGADLPTHDAPPPIQAKEPEERS